MTITLELPPEAGANLAAQAKARGLSLDAFLRTIIAAEAAAVEPVKSVQAIPREGEDLDRAIEELFDTIQVPAGVGEGVMRRENWYRCSQSIPTCWLVQSLYHQGEQLLCFPQNFVEFWNASTRRSPAT